MTEARASDVGSEIRSALEWLRTVPALLHPFVIVNACEPARRFVQFAGDEDRAALLDVPLVFQSFASAPADDLVTRFQRTDFGVCIPNVSPDEGAILALRLFFEAFRVPLDTMFRVDRFYDQGRGVA